MDNRNIRESLFNGERFSYAPWAKRRGWAVCRLPYTVFRPEEVSPGRREEHIRIITSISSDEGGGANPHGKVPEREDSSGGKDSLYSYN